jgi:hypothetical protein
MNFLRRLQYEKPLVFWVLVFVAFYVAFQVLLFVAALVLGPLGLPSWAPIAAVVGVLVLIALRQQRSR